MQAFVFIPSLIFRALRCRKRLARGYYAVANGTALLLSFRVLLLRRGRRKNIVTHALVKNVYNSVAKSRLTTEEM